MKTVQPWQENFIAAIERGDSLRVLTACEMRSRGKSRTYNACLDKARTFGERVGLETQNGCTIETYLLNGQKIAFYSPQYPVE